MMNAELKPHKIKLLHFTFIILHFTFLFSSCSVNNQISKQANKILLKDTAIIRGHIGISIYEPATGKYWYNHDADKYFIPASNTKLFTLYAGMKYLGDSLVGIKIVEYENKISLLPTGDPTLLHPDFPKQPVYDFLYSTKKELWGTADDTHKVKPYGNGWAWDDYNESYMNERSMLPIFGNNIVFSGTKNDISYFPAGVVSLKPGIFSKDGTKGYINKVDRDFYSNKFILHIDGKEKQYVVVPFITSIDLAFKLLADSLHKNIIPPNTVQPPMNTGEIIKRYKIFSRPTDSLFKPMIHNSDNFFAEQTLLMAGNELLGYMNDEAMIDTLLKKDLAAVPQKPKWVDGSGLSRYNLFTPQDFIYILQKMKDEFGLERLKTILPTGGEGTLKNYFRTDSAFIFAKTGTLSNNCALSGFLITQKGKLLIFSILANNYQTGSTPVRTAIENFLQQLRKKY